MINKYVVKGNETDPLSPQYPIRIVYRGMFVYSVESFFLALSIKNKKHQAHVRSEPGNKAVKLVSKYREGSDTLSATDVLYWGGKTLERDSQELDILIDRFFCELITHSEIADCCLDYRKSTVEIHPSALTRIGHIINREEYGRRLSYLIATGRFVQKQRQTVELVD